MFRLDIPGKPLLELEHVVFDFNGTLATAGVLDETVKHLIEKVKAFLEVHIITSDTYGSARNQCHELKVHVETLSGDNCGESKATFVKQLGATKTICIGNGQNDVQMFQTAACSIVIIGSEGCSVKALMSADIAVTNIEDALNMLLNPKTIVATLRN